MTTVLLMVVVCPADQGTLKDARTHLVWGKCGRRYPVREGIPVMLVEEAERE